MRLRFIAVTMGISLVAIASGCHKKVAVAPPPPPAAAPPAREAPTPVQRAERPAPPAPAPPEARPAAVVSNTYTAKKLEDYLNQLLDAFFDYDQANLRTDAQTALHSNSTALQTMLKDFPDAKFVVEGNCDERGSAEYNLGLGERRAQAAKEFLTQIGVPAARLTTISFGQEHPVCTDHNEECWQKNRRAHLSLSASR